MIQQGQEEDPLLTSLLRILRHLEEEQITLNNEGSSLFFGRNRIHSWPELELQNDDRRPNVRNRQITPRTWYLLHRRRGKVSFNHTLDQSHGDSVISNSVDDWSTQSRHSSDVSNSLDDWSIQTKHSAVINNRVDDWTTQSRHSSDVSNSLDDWSIQTKHSAVINNSADDWSTQSKHAVVISNSLDDWTTQSRQGDVCNNVDDWTTQSRHGDVSNNVDDTSVQRTCIQNVERRLAYSGIGCASHLNKVGSVNHSQKRIISRPDVTSRIKLTNEDNSSKHSTDAARSRRTTQLLSGSADEVLCERTIKLLSGPADEVISKRTTKLSESADEVISKRTIKLLSGSVHTASKRTDNVLTKTLDTASSKRTYNVLTKSLDTTSSKRTDNVLTKSLDTTSSKRTEKLLSKSANSAPIESTAKLSNSQPCLYGNHAVCSSGSVEYDDARRGRWRKGIFPIHDVVPAYQKNEGPTDRSSCETIEKRQRRILTRAHSVHMVNLSGTSSVVGLSSASDKPSPSYVHSDFHSATDSVKMNVKVATPRRRSPSPKQRHAPDPPCRPSVTPNSSKMAGKLKQVSTSDLANPDHQGWAMDQLHGTRVWCVLADMLFCTFDSEVASESREVIMLPGCKVRSLVFKSAKRDGLVENAEKANEDRKKTISGVDRYQFLIDNVTSRRKYLFGIETKSELDKWVELLTQASSVDNTADQSNTLNSPRDRADRCVTPTASPYLPTNHRCRRMDIMSMSLGDGKLSESQKHDTIVDFKKRLRRDTDIEFKSHPLRATHTSDSPKQSTTHSHDYSKERNTRISSKEITSKPKSKSFLKLKSFGSLDSLLRRNKNCKKNGEDICDDFEDDSRSSSSSRSRSQSMNARSDSSNSLHSRVRGLSKSSEALNPSTKRRVSDLKDKIFNAKCSPRSFGLRLEDLTDVRICGSLLYKFMARWIKVWCVVSRGCLYGFKSQEADQSPVVAVVLTQCSVTYVTDPEKRSDQLYVFKLSQPHSKNIYLCAQEEGELSKWLQVLQMEASHVLADDNTHMDTSDLNHSVDSAFSTMSLSSSQTDVTDAGQRSPLDQTIVGEHHLEQAERSSSDNSDYTQEDWYNGGCVVSHTDAPVFGMGLDTAPKHDPNLTRVWQKDKGFLFQVIRAKLRQRKRNSPSAGKPTSRDQPGAEAGGLLVLHDDDDEDDAVFETVNGPGALRRVQSVGGDNFFSSDGIGERVTSRRKGSPETRAMSAQTLHSQEVQTPAMNGFLERRSFNGQWTRYWYVIKDECLYCYVTPEDNVTVDVTELEGYQVNTLVDQFRGKRFVIHLHHEDYVHVHLSVESREEMDEWAHALTEATELANQKQEHKYNNGHTDCRRQQTVKQKLLAEVLRQKSELEKKQAARLQIKSVDPVCLSHDSHHGEEHISTLTRLKQRRLSTQIKMSTLQKQLDNKNGTKKSLFHFSKKKQPTSENPHLTEQLKELSQRLHEIDTNLSDQAASVADIGNKPHSTVKFRVTTDINLNKSADTEDPSVCNDLPVRRSNSLKSSVQRFAHRTFAKASWKKSRKPSNLQGDAHPDDVNHSAEHSEDSPDYIDLTCTTPDYQVPSPDERLSFNSSFSDVYSTEERSATHSADSIRSVSQRTEDDSRSVSQRTDDSRSVSQSTEDSRYVSQRTEYSRSVSQRTEYSRSVSQRTEDSRSVPQSPSSYDERMSTSLTLSDGGPMVNGFTDGSSLDSDTDVTSPRREVNPSVMAQIEEFEDFSRQVLEKGISTA